MSYHSHQYEIVVVLQSISCFATVGIFLWLVITANQGANGLGLFFFGIPLLIAITWRVAVLKEVRRFTKAPIPMFGIEFAVVGAYALFIVAQQLSQGFYFSQSGAPDLALLSVLAMPAFSAYFYAQARKLESRV